MSLVKNHVDNRRICRRSSHLMRYAGSGSSDFWCRPWATSAEFLTMLHNVRVNLYDYLNEAEIEIPFDQIVVHNAA